MNLNKYPQVKNECHTFTYLLNNVVESNNKNDFYEFKKVFNKFKVYLSSVIENTYRGINNPDDKLEFLDMVISFYASVTNEIKTYIKWAKDRYKINRAPSYLIVDFLADLSHDVFEKALNMKDKKFNVMVKNKDYEKMNAVLDKDNEIDVKDEEIQDLKDDNREKTKINDLVIDKLDKQTKILECYEKGVIEHKLKLIDGKLMKITKVKPRRTLGLDNAIKVRDLHEKGCDIESLAVTFNVEVNTVVKAIRYETYV